ncbi:MAG TPA: DNA repair protein RecO [Aggregatilineales bacterium]|nr:DNA repair protein RecO [Aggregatilineales bacterium]
MARLERSFKTAAIVLRRQDYGEADRLLTILTPEHGKLRVIAKGVNKPAGRKTGHVELFTRSIMLIRRGREIHVVSQAEMVEPFLPLREDLERGAYANYLAELLDHFTEFEEQNMTLYRLLDSALGWLALPQVDLRLVARYYELHLLQLVGFQPSLFNCAVGQEEITARDQYFSLSDGGVVCTDHYRSSTHLIALNLTVLKTLRYLQTRDYETISKLRLDGVLHLDLERILQDYVVHVLERRLKSVEFIRRLRRMDMISSP